MIKIKKLVRKTKEKIIEFKKDECGGDTINELLILALSLVIIALLLGFALDQLAKSKQKTEEIFQFKFSVLQFKYDNIDGNKQNDLPPYTFSFIKNSDLKIEKEYLYEILNFSSFIEIPFIQRFNI